MCGIFGIHNLEEAAHISYLGLHALQHRGQESAGLAVCNDGTLLRHADMGLVSDVFTKERLTALPGTSAVGHVRYSTSGTSDIRNAQPLTFSYGYGSVSIAHNGNLVNAKELRAELEQQGSIFQSNSDTEVIVHLMARSKQPDTVGRLQDALSRVKGGYALLVLTETKCIAIRDPHGLRPLVMGRLRGAPVFSSETCSFGLIGAEFERDIFPGEMIICEGDEQRSERLVAKLPDRQSCIFEHVYFARPDSLLDGRSIYDSRVRMGRQLAKETPAEADVVIAVPDSGVPAAIGYSQESGTPFGVGLIRSHYMGRTFIEPSASIRDFGVRLKLSPVRTVVGGKRVIVVDDSLVRGTTSRKIATMLRGAGAQEVHLRISAPPTTHSCFYGINTPTRAELIASSKSVEDVRAYINFDSLGYLSHQGMVAAVANEKCKGFCSACFTGKYPILI